uniref:Uncharacterized protein n=1 Tax=Canis lupus dingo TaxID=286419 RepID=A0A8C0JXC1_CANLU
MVNLGHLGVVSTIPSERDPCHYKLSIKLYPMEFSVNCPLRFTLLNKFAFLIFFSLFFFPFRFCFLFFCFVFLY